MVRLLSYPLSPSSPAFGETQQAEFVPLERIADGGVANMITLITTNHCSTHVDAPWHFNPNGKRLTDLHPDEFFFRKPAIIDLATGADEVITGEDLAEHADLIEGADLLLVRTGWAARHRDADPEHFRLHGPGFHTSAGHYLLTEQPSVRGIAMDFISAACMNHLQEGQEFHRVVLGRRAADPYILLIEDARLDPDLTAEDVHRVIMAPLLLQDMDGAPVTMFAESV